MSDPSTKRRLVKVLKLTELCAQTAIQQVDLEDFPQLRESLRLILENTAECEQLLGALEKGYPQSLSHSQS